MNAFLSVPPGFRFHPTDEELVDYYLRKKINSRVIELDVIKDVDLYKIEPWDLQELCRLGTEEQNDWYFFSHKDKKYPTSSRTNRATVAGFWKATGRDKPIHSKHDLVGMRKTLVFYKGRAPNGQKSDWIMHEYRLGTDENATTTQEEGWVVCRVFKKKLPIMRRTSEHEPMWYDDHQVSFLPETDSPTQNNGLSNLGDISNYQYPYGSCKQELDQQQNYQINVGHCPQLPFLEAPKLHSSCISSMPIYNTDINQGNVNLEPCLLIQDQCIDSKVTDWRVIDKFVGSQLPNQGVVSNKGSHDQQSYPSAQEQIIVPEDELNPIYNYHIDQWK